MTRKPEDIIKTIEYYEGLRNRLIHIPLTDIGYSDMQDVLSLVIEKLKALHKEYKQTAGTDHPWNTV